MAEGRPRRARQTRVRHPGLRRTEAARAGSIFGKSGGPREIVLPVPFRTKGVLSDSDRPM